MQVGEPIRLTTDEEYASKSTLDNLYVDYKNITTVIKVNNRIYIDDGLISLLVKNVG